MRSTKRRAEHETLYLRMTPMKALFSALMALVLALGVYGTLMIWSYVALVHAVSTASPLTTALELDVRQANRLEVGPPLSCEARMERLRSWLSYLDLPGAADLDDHTCADAETPATVLKETPFEELAARLDRIDGLWTHELPSGVKVAAGMLLRDGGCLSPSSDQVGDNATLDPGRDQNLRLLADALARIVANVPTGFREGASERFEARLRAPAVVVACEDALRLAPMWWVAAPFVGRPPSAASDREIVDALYDRTLENSDDGRPLADPQAIARQELRTAFALALLDRIRNEKAVRGATYFVTLVRGYEQFAMLWLALFIGLVLRARRCASKPLRTTVDEIEEGTRSATTKAEVDAALAKFKSGSTIAHKLCEAVLAPAGGATAIARVEALRGACAAEAAALSQSAMWIRVTIGFIPTIGFLGTVLGIMGALSEADVIVRSVDRVSQATAVMQVAGQLGLAFSTTAFALVLGLMLRILESRVTLGESEAMADLELALERKF